MKECDTCGHVVRDGTTVCPHCETTMFVLNDVEVEHWSMTARRAERGSRSLRGRVVALGAALAFVLVAATVFTTAGDNVAHGPSRPPAGSCVTVTPVEGVPETGMRVVSCRATAALATVTATRIDSSECQDLGEFEFWVDDFAGTCLRAIVQRHKCFVGHEKGKRTFWYTSRPIRCGANLPAGNFTLKVARVIIKNPRAASCAQLRYIIDRPTMMVCMTRRS